MHTKFICCAKVQSALFSWPVIRDLIYWYVAFVSALLFTNHPQLKNAVRDASSKKKFMHYNWPISGTGIFLAIAISGTGVSRFSRDARVWFESGRDTQPDACAWNPKRHTYRHQKYISSFQQIIGIPTLGTDSPCAQQSTKQQRAPRGRDRKRNRNTLIAFT